MDKICDICGSSFLLKRRNQKRCCAECTDKAKTRDSYSSMSRRRRKVSGIVKEYLGGVCCICGYSKCNRSLDAHHVFPEYKLFDVSSGLSRSLEKTLNEASKCVLLCRNCHGEYHAGQIEDGIIKGIFNSDTLNNIKDSVFEELVTKKKEKSVCFDCGTSISKVSKRCQKCANKKAEKIHWPDTDKLKMMVESTSYVSIGKQLGVSDNAVRKRIRTHK